MMERPNFSDHSGNWFPDFCHDLESYADHLEAEVERLHNINSTLYQYQCPYIEQGEGIYYDERAHQQCKKTADIVELEAEVERLKADVGVPSPCPECGQRSYHIEFGAWKQLATVKKGK